eukprot:1931480-Pleurochrysis_carterae.AAC.1
MKNATASMRRLTLNMTLTARTACGSTTFQTNTTARSTKNALKTSWSARMQSTMNVASSVQASSQPWHAATKRSSWIFGTRSSPRYR